MVYIAYFTELNLQICDYAQKRSICCKNFEYSQNFMAIFAFDQGLPTSATLGKNVLPQKHFSNRNSKSSDDHQSLQAWNDFVSWTSVNRILGWSKNHHGPENVIWKKPLSGVVNKLHTLKSRYILTGNINIILTRLHNCTDAHWKTLIRE